VRLVRTESVAALFTVIRNEHPIPLAHAALGHVLVLPALSIPGAESDVAISERLELVAS
jgi:hypothetical protein